MLAVYSSLCLFVSAGETWRRVTNGGKSSLYIGFTSSLWLIRKLLNFSTCITSFRNHCSYTCIRYLASSCSSAVMAFPSFLSNRSLLQYEGRSGYTYQRHLTKGLTKGFLPNFLRYSSRNSSPAW